GGGTGDGTLLIGVRGNASFNVSNGARVDTFRTEMGVHATAVTSGLISGAGTLWRTDTAFVVGGDLATLTVEDGAKLQVQRFELKNTSTYALDPLSVVEFNGAGTQLNASGSILTGGHTRLLIADGAQMTSDVLWVQQGSTIELSGPGTRGSVDGTGDSLIVFGGSSLQIAGGAQLQSRSARHYIGINEVGTGYVTVSGPGSTWDMGLTDLFLGFNRVGADVGRGNLRLENGATVIAHDIFVGGLSSIEGGYSTLAANVHLLGGTLSPGLSPGPLFIDGDYSQDALSQLIIEIAGLAPGTEYDFLDITGNASLAGEIILRFLDGFAPQVGDSFDFLRVAGVLDIGDALLRIENLADGFDYNVMTANGRLSLVALNDGRFLADDTSGVASPGSFALLALGLLVLPVRRGKQHLSGDSTIAGGARNGFGCIARQPGLAV
ncbi:MAG: hypothetical protein WBN68_15605, partial [Sedimenticolaceae bacterium]